MQTRLALVLAFLSFALGGHAQTDYLDSLRTAHFLVDYAHVQRYGYQPVGGEMPPNAFVPVEAPPRALLKLEDVDCPVLNSEEPEWKLRGKLLVDGQGVIHRIILIQSSFTDDMLSCFLASYIAAGYSRSLNHPEDYWVWVPLHIRLSRGE